MRMIDRIKIAMLETGVCDGMSDEDLDIAVTAALEAMREPTTYMTGAGGNMRIYPSVYMGGPPEQARRDASRIYVAMIDAALNE